MSTLKYYDQQSGTWKFLTTGERGPVGPIGPGLPNGGTTGQFIKKQSNADQDTHWVTPTKADVGLTNVDDTSDMDKPISTATQTALNAKATTAALTSHTSDTSNPHAVTKAQVGLGNVDNTSDVNKPVSTAQAAADALKVDKVNTASTLYGVNGSGVQASFTVSQAFADNSIAQRSTGGTLSVGTATSGTHATNKTYVDTAGALKVSKAGDDMTGNLGTLRLAPVANLTHDLGTASLYYLNGYVRRQYFNSTAYLDGSTAGLITATGQLDVSNIRMGGVVPVNERIIAIQSTNSSQGGVAILNSTFSGSVRLWSDTIGLGRVDAGSTASIDLILNGSGTGKVGINTTAPTHTLTLPSTATGIALYNTVDQTTNYERVRQYWSGNQFNIVSEVSGTGATRAIRLGVYTGGLYISNDSSLTQGFIRADQGSVLGNQSIFSVNGSLTASSNIQVAEVVTPTINQSGTAGYTAILANVTETSTGSGAKNLMDLRVNGVSRFKVTNTGATSIIDGTQGTGKVLTSDASGNASWQAPSGGGSGITRSIVTTSGNVTAGATASTDYVYIITGAHTVTLPTAVGNTNKYDLNNASGSPVSLAFTSGQTANGGGVTLGVNESITLISNNANWRIL